MLLRYVKEHQEMAKRGDESPAPTPHYSLSEWVNLKCQSNTDLSAVHYAAFNGDMESLKGLVEHGADVCTRNKVGLSALHTAA